jgi:succinyl-diaminopimelate desuccinylase
VQLQEFAPGRSNLIARLGDQSSPLVFTGHIDTVPLGASTWRHDPFAAEIDGDRLYGRGSSDMKSGIAAMMIAAKQMAKHVRSASGIALVLTAAEEGGCVGSRHLVQAQSLLGNAGAVVIGEPTSNYPHVGHKGTMKFWATYRGVAAHGSMPHLGDSALYKAACAACRLQTFRFTRDDSCTDASTTNTVSSGEPDHPIMGKPTLNVGTLHSGDTINSVPDRAVLGVDIRTVAGMDHAALLARVREQLGCDVELDLFQDTAAVWSEPENAWVQTVFGICAQVLGEQPVPRTMTYNTDGGNFRRAWPDTPMVILGPGEAAMAHQTDEYCSRSRLGASVAIYEQLIQHWTQA